MFFSESKLMARRTCFVVSRIFLVGVFLYFLSYRLGVSDSSLYLFPVILLSAAMLVFSKYLKGLFYISVFADVLLYSFIKYYWGMKKDQDILLQGDFTILGFALFFSYMVFSETAMIKTAYILVMLSEIVMGLYFLSQGITVGYLYQALLFVSGLSILFLYLYQNQKITPEKNMEAEPSVINSQTAIMPDISASLNEVKNDMNQKLDLISLEVQSQAAVAEESASAMEELSAASTNINSSSMEQKNLAATAIKQAQMLEAKFKGLKNVVMTISDVLDGINEAIQNGKSVIKDAGSYMSEIKNSFESITKITVIMKDLASQTNLLALNASIEAARAGEQGMGFSVVAEEVGKLASRSSSYTKEITEKITHAMHNVQEGNLAVSGVIENFDFFVTEFEEVEKFVVISNEVLVSFEEIKNRIIETISELGDFADNIQLSVAEEESAISETTTAVSQVSEKSMHLMELVHDFVKISYKLDKLEDLLKG